MIVAILAFLAGVLTIFSPCILPVLPFVFARTDRPFVSSTLPLLAGMAVTFAALATLAAVGGAWAVHLNNYGRIVALALLTLSALALLSRRFGDWITRPFVALGSRLSSSEVAGRSGAGTSALLGVATGLLVAVIAGVWQGNAILFAIVLGGITIGVTGAALAGLTVPHVLRLLKRDPQVAAGPIALTCADVIAILAYFNLARLLI